jgi:D-alanine-D-alanine ligase
MNLTGDRTDLPVLMLYNLDRTWAEHEIEEVIAESDQLQAALEKVGHPVTPVVIYDTDLITPLSPYSPDEYIVLNWCEGFPGLPHSDALVAQTLEELNFVYTGSPPQVLALSEDKREVKALLDAHNVPTPQWSIYESAQPDGWSRFPAIVKPAQEHCSLGITPEAVVMTPRDLRDRISYVLDTFQEPALVEDFVDGREFHVWLWGNGKIEMLPPVEMDFSAFGDVRDRLCTYDSKFNPDSVHYHRIESRVPAPLDQDEYEQLEKTAKAAYQALGCRDYARLDIRLRQGVFYVLDVNPNADISPESSLVCVAQVMGSSYGAVGSHLINLATHRKPATAS